MSNTNGVGTTPSYAEAESRLTDFHYAIFALLPLEGQTLGYHPMVVTVRHMRDELNAALPTGQPQLTSGVLQAELRELAKIGLALKVTSLGSRTLGWQKTHRAAELLKAHQSQNTPQRQFAEGERV